MAEAIALLKANHPEVYRSLQFVFAGADLGDEQYRRLVAEKLSTFENCTQIGKVGYEEMPSLYQMADLVVLPSLFETAGIVALESMATGILIVASDTGGLRELLSAARRGIMCQAGDPQRLQEGLCEAIRRLGSQHIDQLMRCNREWVCQNYDWRIISRNIRVIYERVCSENPHPKFALSS
jgi:glycosyltransferase involved in cell wall biosynthesis